MIGYIFFRIGVFLFKIMPFWLMYLLSDILYYILYYVVGYRKKVVRGNLEIAFGKTHSAAEIKAIEKKFYQHLCDLVMEGIMCLTMTDEQIQKRFKVTNPEILDPLYAAGKSAIFSGSHISNWEWCLAGLTPNIKHQFFIIFKPFNNKRIERYFRLRPSKCIMCPIEQTNKGFQAQFEKGNTLFLLLSDQNPANRKKAHWVDFFGKETATLHGIANYAQYYKMPVYYYATKRIKRGYYEATISEIIANPMDYKPEEISQIYMSTVAVSYTHLTLPTTILV